MVSNFILVLGNNGLNLKEIGVASMVLFAVIDILGNIPLIIALKGEDGADISTKDGLGFIVYFGWIFICWRKYSRFDWCWD